MALKLRMSRAGTRHRPFYKIVVADSRKPRDGAFIERLGSYNPMLEKDDKNPTTNLPEYYLPPGACLMCCFVIWAPIMANGIRMFVKKIKNPKPVEIEKRDD